MSVSTGIARTNVLQYVFTCFIKEKQKYSTDHNTA